MPTFIVCAIVGILCIFIGCSNMKGNISTIHSYHRSRVSPDDALPFGRLVGLGTVIIGIAIILFSIFFALTLIFDTPIYTWIGTALLIAGIIAGLFLSFYAMFKYNKGIF